MKTYTHDEVIEIIKQLAYSSAQDFSGGTIRLDKKDQSGATEFTSMYSDLQGKAINTLETALVGKQLEAAIKVIKDAFRTTAEKHRDLYERHVKNIISGDNTLGYAEYTHGGQIQKILNK